MTCFNGTCDCAENEPIAFKLTYKSNHHHDSDEPQKNPGPALGFIWLLKPWFTNSSQKHVMDLSIESYPSGNVCNRFFYNIRSTMEHHEYLHYSTSVKMRIGMSAKRAVGTFMWKLSLSSPNLQGQLYHANHAEKCLMVCGDQGRTWLWVSFGCSGFHHQNKGMQIRSLDYSTVLTYHVSRHLLGLAKASLRPL